ncbi:hypothetical protein JHK87_003682 [Glycine soja]|nr:hypothetical protein JHK87_003682 [Glycine soja]
MTLYMPLFRSCSTLRSLTQLHAHLVVTGLHSDPLASTKLLESYAQMGSLQSSRLVFETHPSSDSFMFGVLVKCYLWHYLFDQVVLLYHHHTQNGSRLTQNCTFLYPSVLKAVSVVSDLVAGRKLHGRIVRDLVSWSSVVTCYVENGRPGEGLEMLPWMVSEGIVPDSVTMLGIAEAGDKVGCLRVVRSVHGYVIRKEMAGDASVRNSLIVMYSQCGYLRGAKGVFESVADQSTACWTSMISSCNQNGRFEEAIDAFKKMQESEVEVNEVTMISVLCCCARLGCLKEGKSVHCFILRREMDGADLDLGPALMHFYSACWKISSCEKILCLIGNSTVVSWNTLIPIYALEGLNEEAMVLFACMLEKGLMLDSFSLCMYAGSIRFGQQIHGHVTKRGFVDEFVQNSLMDMYSKCGFVDLAYTIFEKMKEKSMVTWNCMICGFSQNGISVEALKLFDEKDLYIDTSLVDMYAKCGDLKTAQGVFNSKSKKSVVSWSAMIAAYGIHVDLLSHVGNIGGAYEIIKSACQPIDASIWGALLNGCRIHGRMDFIQNIHKELREIRTDDTRYYTLLYNIYAEGGN